MRASRCGAVRTFRLLLAGATVGRCGLRRGVCFFRKPRAKRGFCDQSAFFDGRAATR